MTLRASAQTVIWMCLAALALGAALSAVYDIFRVSRSTRGFFKALEVAVCTLEDILFFLLAGASAAIIFFVYSYGRVRPLALLMMAAGFFIYRKTVSVPVTFLMKRADIAIRRAVRRIFAAILLPIASLVALLAGAAERACRRARTKRAIRSLIRSAESGFE